MTRLLDLEERSAGAPTGVWDYISPSRLNLWLRCPLAFKLRYIDGIVSPTTPSLFLGKMVHRGLEWHYRHQQLGATTDAAGVCAYIEREWDEAVNQDTITFVSAAEEDETKSKVKALIVSYLDFVQNVEEAPLAVEIRLEAPLVDPDTGYDVGIPLVGIVDLIVGDLSAPLIVDFKTTSRGGRALDVTHEVQLSCYSYLVRHYTAEPEAALEIRSLVKTRVPKIEFHRHEPRTDAHFLRLFSVIRAYLDDLDSQRFIFRPGLGCNMCEFRDTHCRQWQGTTNKV